MKQGFDGNILKKKCVIEILYTIYFIHIFSHSLAQLLVEIPYYASTKIFISYPIIYPTFVEECISCPWRCVFLENHLSLS